MPEADGDCAVLRAERLHLGGPVAIVAKRAMNQQQKEARTPLDERYVKVVDSQSRHQLEQWFRRVSSYNIDWFAGYLILRPGLVLQGRAKRAINLQKHLAPMSERSQGTRRGRCWAGLSVSRPLSRISLGTGRRQ